MKTVTVMYAPVSRGWSLKNETKQVRQDFVFQPCDLKDHEKQKLLK